MNYNHIPALFPYGSKKIDFGCLSDTLAINSFMVFCCCNIKAINNDSAEKNSSLELAALM
jgi:hypothetical protein